MDRLKTVMTLASRTPFWKEFKQACVYADIGYVVGVKEAMFTWLKKYEETVNKLFSRKDKASYDLQIIFEAVCLELEISKQDGVKYFMRDWLDVNRRK